MMLTWGKEAQQLTERKAEEGEVSPFTWGAILFVGEVAEECGMWFLRLGQLTAGVVDMVPAYGGALHEAEQQIYLLAALILKSCLGRGRRVRTWVCDVYEVWEQVVRRSEAAGRRRWCRALLSLYLGSYGLGNGTGPLAAMGYSMRHSLASLCSVICMCFVP